MNGTDLEMGSTIWTTHMASAIQKGLVTEAAVTRSMRRGMRQLFQAGRFDSGVWAELGASSLNSTASQQIQKEAALQGMVLLKNDGLLPLKKGSSIAVIGPMGVTNQLQSDCAGGSGEGGCWPHSDMSCVVTIGDATAAANVGGTTHISAGCDINSRHTDRIAAAVTAAKAADIAVLVLGNDRSQEHEGIDRPDIGLPGVQHLLAKEVLALGKPTLLVLSNGGVIAIDTLMTGPEAIVESFNPNQNTPELAKLLFGENRWGKLPVTIYGQEYVMRP